MRKEPSADFGKRFTFDDDSGRDREHQRRLRPRNGDDEGDRHSEYIDDNTDGTVPNAY